MSKRISSRTASAKLSTPVAMDCGLPSEHVVMKKGKATMRLKALRTCATFAAFVAIPLSFLGVLLPLGCASEDQPNGGRSNNNTSSGGGENPAPTATTTPEEQVQKILDQRKVDFGEALRTASLKLRDRLPDLAEIKQIEGAPDDAAKKIAYEKLIDDMLASPDFARTQIKFWKDTFRVAQTAGPNQQGQLPNNVNKDAAPTFAAELVVEGRNYTELFTATENTCPTFDGTANTFTPTSCQLPTNAVQGPTVGILTDPGLQGQYFANMAFRRVRFIQETFVCTKFPAEFSKTPIPMGNGSYTGLMDFSSISGKVNKPDARVDFQETKATICANCHININHLAPLFLNWDMNGALKATPQVKVPIAGEPFAQRIDYLPEAEGLAWRKDKPITDMATLGQAMAADPDVAHCAVNRVWNYAMSRGDIVNDLASVPPLVTQPYVDKFKASGMKLKETLREVFKSEDFTKF